MQFLVSFLNTMHNLEDRSERGATAVEYGLMVSLIAVAIIAAVTLVGTNLVGIFETVAAALV